MKSKVVAGILALLGGYVGAHRFYLGDIGGGLFYFFLFIALSAIFPFLIPILWMVEVFGIFTMNQETFDKRYNQGYRRHRPRANAPAREEMRQQDRRREEVRNPRKRQNSNDLMEAGKKAFKDFDLDLALEAFNKATQVDPQNAAIHYNLACTHSLLENKDEAFYHLDRATALGFNDFERIKTTEHLAWLRIQPEFETFKSYGYRLTQGLRRPQSDDLLEQLNRLNELKNKGLLTEEEFRMQKEKLTR